MAEKDDLKEVEYYAALYNAWVNSRMERDKSLLILSGGAIGLLVTLLTTIGVSSVHALMLYALAILSFVVCSASLVIIFGRNSEHLEQIAKGEDKRDEWLGPLDRVALGSFFFGIVLSLAIGLSTGIDSLQESRESAMSKKEETTVEIHKPELQKKS